MGDCRTCILTALASGLSHSYLGEHNPTSAPRPASLGEGKGRLSHRPFGSGEWSHRSTCSSSTQKVAKDGTLGTALQPSCPRL